MKDIKDINDLQDSFDLLVNVQNRINNLLPDAKECNWTIAMVGMGTTDHATFGFKKYQDCFEPRNPVSIITIKLVNGKWKIVRMGTYSEEDCYECMGILKETFGGVI